MRTAQHRGRRRAPTKRRRGRRSAKSRTRVNRAGARKSGGSPETLPTKSKSEQLADLLRDPPADSQSEGSDDRGEDGGSRKSKPKKFNDLAELSGVDEAELYKLEIASAADGSPVTVEQLKDHYAKRSDFSVAQLKWEEERSQQNGELVRGNAELRELLAALPRDKITPEVLEKVRGKVEANIQRERKRTLKVIPEWRDEAKMTEELAGMAEFLGRYGYPPDYLKTVHDHRALNMMRDAWAREKRVRAALEAVEKVDTTQTPAKSRASGKAPSKPTTGPQSRGRAGLESLLAE